MPARCSRAWPLPLALGPPWGGSPTKRPEVQVARQLDDIGESHPAHRWPVPVETMRSLARRVTLPLIALCVFFALAVVALSTAAMSGISSATGAGKDIDQDELTTASATAQVGFSIDQAYALGLQLALGQTPASRAAAQAELFSVAVPDADNDIANLVRLHQGDPRAEWRGIQLFEAQWRDLRELLGPLSNGGRSDLAGELARAYAPIARHLVELVNKERHDARAEQEQASAHGRSTDLLIFSGAGACCVLALVFGQLGARRVRRAVEPERAQVEFGETLQIARDEEEAYLLIQRHLQRSLAQTSAVVLNRNNSADRLEAVTALPPGSPLSSSLRGASPSSCLAIRSGRVHQAEPGHEGLLTCAVCSGCPGSTACLPVVVSGEVIGSVLLTAPAALGDNDQRRAADSVAQAAPVIANLRNLAVAELRASTDALTGLPNKRAVGETMKRMFAQASRTESPFTVVLIDLDHFKEVNDRHGHPVGDQVLANVGAILRDTLRAGDFAGRNGGEEFALLLPSTDTHGGLELAERLRAALAEAVHAGLDDPVTASIGLATYPEHAGSLDRIERLADAALYTAKRSGRNRVEQADPSTEPTHHPSATETETSMERHGGSPRPPSAVRL